MKRACAIAIGLLLAACEGGSKPGTKPDFPERIVAGSFECESCGDVRGQTCGYMFEWGCGPKESCGESVPCDPVCCSPPPIERVGLDEAPWGPVLASVAADERAPVGMLALVVDSDLFLIPPDRQTPEPEPLMRFPERISSWRFSAAHRQLLYTVWGDRQLRRFDLETRTTTRVPYAALAAGPFDVTARGDRAAFLLLGDPHAGGWTLGVLDLAGTAVGRWTMPTGGVEYPAWDPLGTRLAFEVWIRPFRRVRIADIDARTVVNSARDEADLRRPAWHPSGDFLAVWRDTERCTLELMAPDGIRRAELPIVFDEMACPRITFSPDGRHLAIPTSRGLSVVKLSAPNDGAIVTARNGEDGPLWLDDEAAAVLSELAGFGLGS